LQGRQPVSVNGDIGIRRAAVQVLSHDQHGLPVFRCARAEELYVSSESNVS
jgi:hypothetical protein